MDHECARCGAGIGEGDDHMVVGIEFAGDAGHEFLGRILLCRNCGRDLEDRLSLETVWHEHV